MIDSITLTNFQGHKRKVLELDPNITTIVGPSDAGKTAILRALRWVAFNKPSGLEFIRHGESQAKVVLNVDGVSIRRIRSDSKNTYHVGSSQLKSFKTSPPDEVSKILNVTDVNFKMAFDGPFWFSLSGSQIAQKLNEIADLSKIDSALKHIKSEIRKLTAEIEFLREEVQASKETVELYSGIEDLVKDLNRTKKLHKRYANLTKDAAILYKRVTEAEQIEAKLGEAPPEITPVKQAYEQVQALERKGSRLKATIEQVEQSIIDLRALKRISCKAHHKLHKLKGAVCPTCHRPISKEET